MTTDARLDIEIAIETAQWDALADAEQLIDRALHRALAVTDAEISEGAEVSVLLCDDAFIADLNRKWRDRDTPTNVLSFPADGDLAATPLIGDIIIAFETTAREAAAESKTLADHFTHLAVHGFLHLLGYDHETDAEAEEMEALERTILASLNIADPYCESSVESVNQL